MSTEIPVEIARQLRAIESESKMRAHKARLDAEAAAVELVDLLRELPEVSTAAHARLLADVRQDIAEAVLKVAGVRREVRREAIRKDPTSVRIA